MGRPRTLNLPPYVRHWRDKKTGRPYSRFRHPNAPERSLPGLPWSTEFMEAYQAALTAAVDAKQAAQTTIGAGLAKPGSLRAAATAYLADTGWSDGLRDSTQKKRRRVVERFAEKHGDKQLVTLRADQLQQLFDKLSPANQRSWRKALHPFFKWCRRKKLIGALPTEGLELRKLPKSEGFATATEDEIARYRACWALGTPQRLEFEVLLNLGARGRSDARLFGRQHIGRDGKFRFTARKNNRKIGLPVLPDLAACIATMPADQMLFLQTKLGGPMAENTFSEFMRKAIGTAGLSFTPHGLRKACATRLKHAGVSDEDIAAVLGDSVRMVKIYTAAANDEIATDRAFRQLQAAESGT